MGYHILCIAQGKGGQRWAFEGALEANSQKKGQNGLKEASALKSNITRSLKDKGQKQEDGKYCGFSLEYIRQMPYW